MMVSSDLGDMALVAVVGSPACPWVLPRLVCCCEVEATVAGSLWRTMTGDRRFVR
jgi:hypothetical protein